MIQHASDADAQSKDPKQLDLLKTKYQLVLKRASEIKIINPKFIPNTELANTYLSFITQQQPDKSADFRKNISRFMD